MLFARASVACDVVVVVVCSVVVPHGFSSSVKQAYAQQRRSQNQIKQTTKQTTQTHTREVNGKTERCVALQIQNSNHAKEKQRENDKQDVID